MASAGSVTILLRAIDKTKAGIKKAETNLKKFTQKVKELSMLQYGAIAGVAYGVKKVFTGVSDTFEAINKTKVVFGEASKIVIDWAKKNANAWGMTQAAALDYAGALGAILVSTGMTKREAAEMSLKLEQVAADLTSIYNIRGGVSEALAKIKSGLVGMAIPLRDVGVLLSEEQIKQRALKEGVISTGKELTQQQKVLLRYKEILEQTKLIQGDFQRTSMNIANSSRILKSSISDTAEEIANNFYPLIQALILILREVVGWFNKIPLAVRTTITVLTLLVTTIKLLGIKMALLSGPLGYAIAGISALAGIFIYLRGVINKANQELDDYRLKISGMSNAQIIKEYEVLSKKQEELRNKIKQYTEDVKNNTESMFFGLIKSYKDYNTQLKANDLIIYKNRLEEINEKMKVLAPQYKRAKALVDQLNESMKNIPSEIVTTLSIKADFSDVDMAEEWLLNFYEMQRKENEQAVADVYGYINAFKEVFDTAHQLALGYVASYKRVRSQISKINYDAEIKDRIKAIQEWAKAEQEKLKATQGSLTAQESFSKQVTTNMAFSIKNLIADEAIGWVDKAWERSFGKANSLLQQFGKLFVKTMMQVAALSLVQGIFKGLGLAIPFNTGGVITAFTGYSVGADTVPILASPGEAIIPAESVTQNRIEVQNLIYGNSEEKEDVKQDVNINVNLEVQAWDGTDVMRVVNSDEFREAMKKAIAARNLNFKMQHGKLELI